MDELSPELRALLARSRADTEPNEADEDRIRAKLAASLAAFDGVHGLSGAPLPDIAPTAGTPPSVPSTPPGVLPPISAPASVAGATVAWMTAGALLLAATGYVALGRREPRVQERPLPAAAARPSSQPASAPTSAPRLEQQPPAGLRAAARQPIVSAPPGESEPQAAPLPPLARPRRTSRRATPPRSKRGSLQQQVAMLQSAARALHGGDPLAAARLVRTHARRFPRSALSPEREVLEVRVLCAMGEAQAARTRAAEFLARHPNSPLATRIQRACE